MRCGSAAPALSLLPACLPAVGSPRALGPPSERRCRLSTRLPYLCAVESARRTAQRPVLLVLWSHDCKLSLPENRDCLLVGTKPFISYLSGVCWKSWCPVSPSLSPPCSRVLTRSRRKSAVQRWRRRALFGASTPPGSCGCAATGPTQHGYPLGEMPLNSWSWEWHG